MVVTRNEQRPLPVVRLYCNEAAPDLDSRVEQESRLEAKDFFAMMVSAPSQEIRFG